MKKVVLWTHIIREKSTVYLVGMVMANHYHKEWGIMIKYYISPRKISFKILNIIHQTMIIFFLRFFFLEDLGLFPIDIH